MELKQYLEQLNNLSTKELTDPVTGHRSLYTIYKGASFKRLKEKLIAKDIFPTETFGKATEARGLTVPYSHLGLHHVIDVKPDSPDLPFYRGGQGEDFATIYLFPDSEKVVEKAPEVTCIQSTDRWSFAIKDGEVIPGSDKEPLTIKRDLDPETGETVGLSVNYEPSFQGSVIGLDSRFSSNPNTNLMDKVPSPERLEDLKVFKTTVERTLNNQEVLEKSFTHEDNDGKHYAIYIGGLKALTDPELFNVIANLKNDKWAKIEPSAEPGVVSTEGKSLWLLFTEASAQAPRQTDEARRNELITSVIDYIDHKLKDMDGACLMHTVNPSSDQELYGFGCSIITLPDDKGIAWINSYYQERGWKSVTFTDNLSEYERDEESTSTFVIMERALDASDKAETQLYDTMKEFVEVQVASPLVMMAAMFSSNKAKHEMRYGFTVQSLPLPDSRGISKLIKHFEDQGWKDAYFTDSLSLRQQHGVSSAKYFVLVKDTTKEDKEFEERENILNIEKGRKWAAENFPNILENISKLLLDDFTSGDKNEPYHAMDKNDIPYTSICCNVTDVFEGVDALKYTGFLRGMLIKYYHSLGYDYAEFVYEEDEGKTYFILSHFNI